jgi:hypothetical protein
VIPEVDAALEALVRRDVLNGSRVEVMFDAPTKDWVARRNAPAIDLYLYDIREDLPRRQLARENVRNDDGIVTERRLPVRRFRLSYLVTAWTQRPEDEHRLLATCLATFVRNEFVPPELVNGSLAEAPYPVYLMTCMPPTEDRSIADVWSAMGGELKPSLDVVAIAPLDVNWRQEVAAAVTAGPTLDFGRGGDDGAPAERIARSGDRRASRGRWGNRGQGRDDAVVSGRRSVSRRAARVPLGPDDPAVQDETLEPDRPRDAVASGERRSEAVKPGVVRRRRTPVSGVGSNAAAATEDAVPGRRLRIRGIARPAP